MEEADEIARGFGFIDHANMIRLMAARGLHVVTAADAAVIQRLRAVSEKDVRAWRICTRVFEPTLTAELEARGLDAEVL